MTIYLIRHGKTAANEQHLYCGSSDPALSEAGAQALSRHDAIFGAVYMTSGMRRTNQTLKILFGDVPFTVDPGFREVNFGIFEGNSYDQLKEDPAYQAWISGDNEQNVPPGGESGAQMTERVLEAFARIRQDTVLITHGGVIAAIMAHLFPDEGKNRYQWQPGPGEGYVLQNGTWEYWT